MDGDKQENDSEACLIDLDEVKGHSPLKPSIDLISIGQDSDPLSGGRGKTATEPKNNGALQENGVDVDSHRAETVKVDEFDPLAGNQGMDGW